MIEKVSIGTNRYAPPEAQNINLYNLDDGRELTLGQLLSLVCLKAGLFAEEQSIKYMNKLTSGTENLDKASDCMSQLAKNTVKDWEAMKDYFIYTLNIKSSELPNGIDTYDKRMQAVQALKNALDTMTRQAQEDMIEVQSFISNRKTAFTAATNLVAGMGRTKTQTAETF